MSDFFIIRLDVKKPLSRVTFFDIGKAESYFDVNEEFVKITISSFEKKLKEFKNYQNFKFNFVLSGEFIDFFKAHKPSFLDEIKEFILLHDCKVFFEPYHHSLSYLYDFEEFRFEFFKSLDFLENFFGFSPVGFINSDFKFSDELNDFVDNKYVVVLEDDWLKDKCLFNSRKYLFIGDKYRVIDFFDVKEEADCLGFEELVFDRSKRFAFKASDMNNLQRSFLDTVKNAKDELKVVNDSSLVSVFRSLGKKGHFDLIHPDFVKEDESHYDNYININNIFEDFKEKIKRGVKL